MVNNTITKKSIVNLKIGDPKRQNSSKLEIELSKNAQGSKIVKTFTIIVIKLFLCS